MNPLVPGYLTPLILTGSVATLAMVLFGVYWALERAPWAQEERSRTFWSATFVLVGWFGVALLTSALGLYHGTSLKTPTIQYPLLVPIALGIVLFWRWPLLRRLVETVPNAWIAGVQIYRVLGGIFLILYAGGYIPGFFALPAGIGDVIVGVLAPVVAVAYARGLNNRGIRLRAWNLLGIADLVVAVATGFLSSPSQLQLVAFDRPNDLISAFPLVMIPVFLVPLSILLHFASLYKLASERKAKSTGEGGLATKSVSASAHKRESLRLI